MSWIKQKIPDDLLATPLFNNIQYSKVMASIERSIVSSYQIEPHDHGGYRTYRRPVMALTEEQDELITDMLQDLAAVQSELGEWAQGFVSSLRERHERYGSQMYMSEKQWNKLSEIHRENVGDTKSPDDGPKEVDDEIPF